MAMKRKLAPRRKGKCRALSLARGREGETRCSRPATVAGAYCPQHAKTADWCKCGCGTPLDERYRLVPALRARGMSQPEVARFLGINNGLVSFIERGKTAGYIKHHYHGESDFLYERPWARGGTASMSEIVADLERRNATSEKRRKKVEQPRRVAPLPEVSDARRGGEREGARDEVQPGETAGEPEPDRVEGDDGGGGAGATPGARIIETEASDAR